MGKKSDLEKSIDMAFGGAMTLQGVNVLRDVRAGRDLTGHVPAYMGIGIAGSMSNVARRMIRESAYPVKKRGKKKRR